MTYDMRRLEDRLARAARQGDRWAGLYLSALRTAEMHESPAYLAIQDRAMAYDRTGVVGGA